MKIKANLAIIALYGVSIALLFNILVDSKTEAMKSGCAHLNKASNIQSTIVRDPRSLNELHAAINDFNQVLLFERDNLEAHSNRASAYFKLGNFEKAIEDYNFCLNLAPRDWYHYHVRALAFEKLGRTEEAYRDYNAAVTLAQQEINPSSAIIANRSLKRFMAKSQQLANSNFGYQ